jgi:hypothetical protein
MMNFSVGKLKWRAFHRTLIFCCTLGVPILLSAGSLAEQKPEILVILTGFQSDSGHALVSLHNREKSFPGDADGAKKLARAKIKGKKSGFTISQP